MKKTLLYYFYIDKNDYYYTDIHLSCLRYYSDIFDEVKICLSIDDINDFSTIKNYQEKFLCIFNKTKKDITFIIQENTFYLGESLFFYNELVKKLNEYELVFYCHGKRDGTLKLIIDSKEELFKLTSLWIVGCYYLSLNFMEEVKNTIEQDSKSDVFYGSYLMNINNLGFEETVFSDNYCGTFFWINCKKLYSTIKTYNLEIPEVASRYYSEQFPSYILKSGKTSHDSIILDSINIYNEVERCTKESCGNEYNDFLEFYNRIINIQ